MATGGKPLGEMTIGMSLDGTQFSNTLKGIQKQIKTSQSAMKANISVLTSAGDEYGALESKVEGLNDTMSANEEYISQLRSKYDEMASTYGETSEEAQKYAKQVNDAVRKQSSYQKQLDNTKTKMNDMSRGTEEYKERLNQSTRKVQAQVKAHEAQGNVYQATQSKLNGLKESHELQGQVVDNEKEKLQELKETYGENSSEVREQQTVLEEAQSDYTELGSKIDNLQDKYGDLSDGMATTKDKLNNVGDKLQTTGDKISGFGDKWTTMSSTAIGAIGGITGSLFALSSKVAGTGDEIATQARKMGTTTDFYQEMDYWASQNGISQENFQKSIERLNQRMGRARDGNEKYSEALSELGVDMGKVKDGTISTEEAFDTAISTLSNMEDKQETSAKASELFGTKLSRELMPALDDSAKSTEDARDEFDKLGIKMSDDQIEASQEFEASYDKIKRSLQSVVTEIGTELMPYMEDLMDWVQDNLPEIKEKAVDTTEAIIDKAQDLIEAYQDLSPEAKTAVKTIGAISTVGGPAVSTIGHLTSGVGNMVGASGNLISRLGSKGGKGLLGALTGLTKLGVVGLAIGAVGGLAYGVKKLIDKNKDAKEVNLDTAQSFADQADELENSKDKFEKLTDKADLSNDELAEMNGLNKRISESNNPGEIKNLKDRYNELADKSGLSNDKLNDLWDANDDIIEQAPDVKTSVDDTGEAFVDSTEKVDDYIQSLRDYSEKELEFEQKKLLEQQDDALEKRNNKQKEAENLQNRFNQLLEDSKLSEDEIHEKMGDIVDKQHDQNLSKEEWNRLENRRKDLSTILNDEENDRLETLKDQKEEAEKQKDKAQETLDKLDKTNKQMSNIYLQNVDINKEGDEGLKKLDKNISKHRNKINELEKEKQKKGELSKEDQKTLDKLREKVGKEKDARDKIFEQTGLYNDLNNLVDGQVRKLEGEKGKRIDNLLKSHDLKKSEGDILGQLEDQKSALDDKIQKIKDNTGANGKLTSEQKDQISNLKDQKSSLDDVKRKILKAVGFKQDEIDKIIGAKKETDKQGDEIDDNNQKTRDGVKAEEDRTAEASKDVSKDVDVLPTPTLDDFNSQVQKYKVKPVGINKDPALANLDDDVKQRVYKDVGLNVKPSNNELTLPLLQYAKGTEGHPYNGPAVVGDGKGANAGRELITPPKSKPFLSPPTETMMNLPEGTHVTPAKETRSMIPQYANGTDDVNTTLKMKKLGMSGLGDSLISGGIGSSVAAVTKSAIGTMTDMLKSGNLGLSSSGSGHIGGASSWRRDVRNAASVVGENPSRHEVNGVLSQIQLESGGNQNAVQGPGVWDINMAQGNPAQGLLQYIPETFSAYHVPGHNDIMSGFDQLLAFFNNKNWRRDLPYGRSGWGPSGATKYENGGFSTTEKLAHISEDNKPEAIIPLSSGKRTRAMSLLNQTQQALGVPNGGTVTVNNDNSGIVERQDEQMNMMQQQIDLLTQILMKDSDVNLDSDKVGKVLDKKQDKENKVKNIARGR